VELSDSVKNIVKK